MTTTPLATATIPAQSTQVAPKHRSTGLYDQVPDLATLTRADVRGMLAARQATIERLLATRERVSPLDVLTRGSYDLRITQARGVAEQLSWWLAGPCPDCGAPGACESTCRSQFDAYELD